MHVLRSRNTKLVAFMVALLSVITLGAGSVMALTDQTSSQGVVNQTIYKAGSNVVITGTVNGDVYCAGQTVNIDATVNGDVICGGQTVTVNGTVNGNLRVGGQTVNIGAKVSNNVSVAGQNITFQSNSSVGRDALVAGQQVQFDGTIGRNLDLGANTATINSSVAGNLSARLSDKLSLTGNAKIGGYIDYTSPNKLVKNPDAVVTGTVTYHKTTQNNNQQSNMNWTGWTIFMWIFCFLALTLLSLVLVAIFPRKFQNMQALASQKIGYVFLTGFLTMLAVPFVIIVLFCTIIGIPLALLVLCVWASVVILSIPVAVYLLGRRLTPRLHPLVSVLIGVLLFCVLGAIPFIGWLFTFVLYVLGLGTICWSLINSFKKPQLNKGQAK